MPWKPSYTESAARKAVTEAANWKEALAALGLEYHGKNITVLRKWLATWGILSDHLSDHRGRRRTARTYDKEQARAAIAASLSWSEALRRLGYCHTGANPKTLQRRAAEWGLDTSHFDPYAAARGPRKARLPLAEILVEDSTYSREHLKRRLYEAGLKDKRCELCGQGEVWRGVRISLILDHVNGIRDDNRLENLRIACPNCAATLDTHCARNKPRRRVEPLACLRCGKEFMPRYRSHRYCSPECGRRWDRRGRSRPGARRVSRPPRDQLLREIHELGYSGTGRKYGVTHNAVRKWIRGYERERAIAEGRDPDSVDIPRRTWPNMKKAA